MRILNHDALTSHGHVEGRKILVRILEAGLEAADPYNNIRRLVRLDDGRLVIGHPHFEPTGSPSQGDEVYSLSDVGKILVLGAGKGVQRIAKAIEDVLGDRLTGGHVIAKKGDGVILHRIGVTLGGHPVPDEDCVRGCESILALTRDLGPKDLVFTIACNGVSSLLTMPVPGVSLEDVRRTTHIMQIQRGAPTEDLNPVRNHLDIMKGGRVSTHIHPARAIHIFAWDPIEYNYEHLMRHNLWLHFLPDCTTFQDAVRMLQKWDAWDAVPSPVRAHLTKADPMCETVTGEAFEKLSFRAFGVMPKKNGMLEMAQKEARTLGLNAITLSSWLQAEALEAAKVLAGVARTVESEGQPCEPPCALFTTGELLVTVGRESGIGGRNQEYALSAALEIAGSANILMAAVDSDGTDGPGDQFQEGQTAMPTLAGGIVDGETARLAERLGVDIQEELRRHNATPALWRLGSGIVASQSISMVDLGVTLVLRRR